MSKKCTNPFLESDGFCTRCSEYHFKTNKRGDVLTTRKPTINKREKLQAEKSASIQRTIENTPQYKVAKETVEMLSEIYDIQVKIVFTNLQASYHIKRKTGHVIKFGYQSLDRSFENGFDEYKILQWMINYKKIDGIEGARQEAMHEFSHVLQTEIPGGRTYGSCHNETFIKCYQEVMELVN